MQEILPLIGHGTSQISGTLSVAFEGDRWIYFHGCLPVFTHHPGDKQSFRMITSSFIYNGACRNIDIQRTFNVSKESVIRNLKKFKEKGSEGFFSAVKKNKRKSKVLTPEKIQEAEELLSIGFTRREASSRIMIEYSTLCKAISSKRVSLQEVQYEAIDKSERSRKDAAMSLSGTACTRIEERVLAAFGFINTVESRFERCNDVSFGGVLTALAALETNGLYYKLNECFEELKGYYSVIQVVTLLGIMALCRIKTVENLRWQSPGEIGKLIGLDRIPEVRCLRNKLDTLSRDGAAQKWGEFLSKKWMSD